MKYSDHEDLAKFSVFKGIQDLNLCLIIHMSVAGLFGPQLDREKQSIILKLKHHQMAGGQLSSSWRSF